MLGTPLAQVPEDLQSVRSFGTVALRPENSHLADVFRPGLGRTAVLEEKAPQVFEQGWITHFDAHGSRIGTGTQEGLGNSPLTTVYGQTLSPAVDPGLRPRAAMTAR